jgi:malic enzyme
VPSTGSLSLGEAKAFRKAVATLVFMYQQHISVPAQTDKNASLLPPFSEVHRLDRLLGQAVGRQAIIDGHAQVADEDALNHEVEANIWEPVYVPYEHKRQIFDEGSRRRMVD